MRVTIVAAGRLRAGPERTLVSDYLARTEKSGRAVGLHPVAEVELEPKGGLRQRTAALLDAVPKGAQLIVLDERGRAMESEAFARKLADLRDGGMRDIAFLIGDADGLHEEARARADVVLAFGPATWPHRLVRVMLAEQIYRAVAILAGSPYHRGDPG
jgi:23S rRNA (pseudouridine1915-N3)-methyltransferase